MKLLNYASVRYLLFTALILLVSNQIFYVVLNKVFILSIHKDLYQQASEITSQQNAIKSGRYLELWRKLDHNLEIVSANKIVFH